jgi:hypothetical protein
MNHLLHAQKPGQSAGLRPKRRGMRKGRKMVLHKSNANRNLQGRGIATSLADQSVPETRLCPQMSQKGRLMSQWHQMESHPLSPLLPPPYQTLLKRSPYRLLSPLSRRSDFLPSRRTNLEPSLPRVLLRANQRPENLAPSLQKQRVALVSRKKTLWIHYRH